jgi:hypothetical protein
VQVKLQPGITRYESVVYSKIGLGTRWWADPQTPQDETGPATQPGHTFAYGAMSYTVPQGYLAWDVTFNEVVTGTAAGAANYVVSGEQLGWTPRCASTLLAEQHRSGWIQWPTGTGPVHGTFRLVALFYSRNHLKHGICSYLVNSSTKHTYAHASRYWSNS